jgi:hypothetical protein
MSIPNSLRTRANKKVTPSGKTSAIEVPRNPAPTSRAATSVPQHTLAATKPLKSVQLPCLSAPSINGCNQGKKLMKSRHNGDLNSIIEE